MSDTRECHTSETVSSSLNNSSESGESIHLTKEFSIRQSVISASLKGVEVKKPEYFIPRVEHKFRRFLVYISDENDYFTVKNEIIRNRHFEYFISSKHVLKHGTKEKRVIQIYCTFKRSVSLESINSDHVTSKWCSLTHKYMRSKIINEDTLIEEEGVNPRYDTIHRLSQLSTVKDFSILPYKTLHDIPQRKIDFTDIFKLTYRKKLKTYYIYGGTERLRNEWVLRTIGDQEYDAIQYANHRWEGISYDKQTTIAWYINFNDRKIELSEFKQVTEYFTKNTMMDTIIPMIFKYTTIYITSSKPIDEIFKKTKLTEMRRTVIGNMTEIDLDKIHDFPEIQVGVVD